MMHLRHSILPAIVCAVTLPAAPAWAQSPAELAKLEPKELYFQAWSLNRDAEDMEERNDMIGAFSKYRKARTFYDIIKLNHPDYNPDLVKDKAIEATKAMEKIHALALAQQKEREGDKSTPLIEIPGVVTQALVIPKSVDPKGPNAAQLTRLQGQIDRLQQQLNEMTNQRGVAAARLRSAIDELKQTRSKLASAPLRDDMAELNRQVAQLRRERDAMRVAKNKAEAKAARTLQKLEKTQDELAKSRAKEKELLAVIKKQDKINSKVVTGQQEQLAALRDEIAEKDRTFQKVTEEVRDLKSQLAQSQAFAREIAEERDALIEERDQLNAFLKLNEKDAIEQMLTQNLQLSKELNEARANLTMVREDSNATKEKVRTAMQALAVAKAKIENLQKERDEGKQSIERLKKKLKLAEDDLLAQINGGELNNRGKQEVAMLQSVIKKLNAQIRAQEQTGRMLVEQGVRLGETDKTWAQAMKHATGDKTIEWSDEELQLLEVAEFSGDGVNLTSAIRPTAQEYQQATSKLAEFKKDLQQVANRLFKKGDFQAARGNLQLIVDEDPGEWESMINLGIVQMRLERPEDAAQNFRQAIMVAGDRKIPFAHFMLGDVLYKVELFDDAREELQTSLDLDSENAKAHILLGNISYKTGSNRDAEFHFREASRQNPNLIEPYLNLSIILLEQGQKKEAKTLYQDYLRRGGPARPVLEEKLKN